MRIFFLIFSFMLLTACGQEKVPKEYFLEDRLTFEEASELQKLPNGKELVDFFEGLSDAQKTHFTRSAEFSQLRAMLHMHVDTAHVQRNRAADMIKEITSL